MKKLALVLGTLAITTALAFAHGGWGGYGMGPGYGMNGRGFGPGACYGYNNENFQVKQLTEEEAVKAVKDVITENYKGYEIVKTEKFNMPMGTAYQVEVKDAGGNLFTFHVNPFGRVVGPFLAQ